MKTKATHKVGEKTSKVKMTALKKAKVLEEAKVKTGVTNIKKKLVKTKISRKENEKSENTQEELVTNEEQSKDTNDESQISSKSNDQLVDASKSKVDTAVERMKQKYNERMGKQLFIRFPWRLPEDEQEFQQMVTILSPLITKAHKPRQKHARFCLVDFKSKEDRDTALASIKSSVKENDKFKRIFVAIPRTESEKFLSKLVEKTKISFEKKKLKAKLKRASKMAQASKNLTSSIVIPNMPKTASNVEIRKLFPNAVDIQVKPNRHKPDISTVCINLPNVADARAAVASKPTLNGIKLTVRFNK